MTFITGLFFGLLVGAVGGFLVGFLMYRNNAAKLADAEAQIKKLGG